MSKIFKIFYRLLSVYSGGDAKSLYSKFKILTVRGMGVRIGSNCLIGRGVIFDCPEQLTIGNGTGFGLHNIISCPGGVTIGSRVMMGSDVMIYTSNHIWSPTLKTYIAQGLSLSPVFIGDDCWLGSRCIILPGVVLGHGVTVAAGAVVTKSAPDFAVIAGVPAKIVKIKDSSIPI